MSLRSEACALQLHDWNGLLAIPAQAIPAQAFLSRLGLPVQIISVSRAADSPAQWIIAESETFTPHHAGGLAEHETDGIRTGF